MPFLDIVELYRATSSATKEDCDSCNNSPEIDQFSNFCEAAYNDLKGLVGDVNFMTKAIERTKRAQELIENLPSSLKTWVEPSSSINERKGNI